VEGANSKVYCVSYLIVANGGSVDISIVILVVQVAYVVSESMERGHVLTWPGVSCSDWQPWFG